MLQAKAPAVAAAGGEGPGDGLTAEEVAAEACRAAEREELVGVRPAVERQVRRVVEVRVVEEVRRGWRGVDDLGGEVAGWSRIPRPAAVLGSRARPRAHIACGAVEVWGVRPRQVMDLLGRRFLWGRVVGHSRVTPVTRAPGECLPYVPRRRRRGAGFGVCVPPRWMWGTCGVEEGGWVEEAQAARGGRELSALASAFADLRCSSVVVRSEEVEAARRAAEEEEMARRRAMEEERRRREEEERGKQAVTAGLRARIHAMAVARGMR